MLFTFRAFRTQVACEQALFLGDIVKSGRARGRKRRREGSSRPLAACFARSNRRACSLARTQAIHCFSS